MYSWPIARQRLNHASRFTRHALSFKRQQERLLKRTGDPAQEARRVGPVNQPVVVRQRQRQHQSRLKAGTADAAEVGDGERAALHLFKRQLLVARTLSELIHLDGELLNVLLVHVAYDRHEQSAIRINRDADVIELFEDDLVARLINAGI